MIERREHVLITGATGALGREILVRVVEEMQPARVTLLIRGRDASDVRRRYRDLARYLATWRPRIELRGVTALPADIVRPDLGLDPSIGDALAHDVTHVVHSAATVRLTLPPAQARETNVRGTEVVLQFAERCPRLVRLAHVSTAYVAGDRRGLITEDELDCGQGFLNTYERSKFEAETLVRRRMRDLPITVIRPSIIVGDSRDGHASAPAAIFPVLRHVASGGLRSFPGHGSTRLDLVPVDYVADVVVRLLRAPQAEGGTFHATAGAERAIAARRLFELTVRDVGSHPERALHFHGMHRVDPHRSHRRLWERLQCYFDYLFADKAFDNAGLVRALGPMAPSCPRAQIYLPRVLAFAWGRAAARDSEPEGAGLRGSVSESGGPG